MVEISEDSHEKHWFVTKKWVRLARENSRTKKRDGFRIAECVPFSIGLECRQGFRGYGQDGDLQASLRSRWNIGIAAQAIKFLTTRARLGAGVGQAVEVVLALAARGNDIAVPQ